MSKIRNKQAFTLIELLVVVSIIAALMAVLVPTLGKVKQIVTNLRQKGEFHGMEISIELYQNEFSAYPDSAVVSNGGVDVCGAQRLAEAMEGRDEQGFHPKSKWHPGLETAAGLTLYDNAAVDTSKQRKPVYFELKHTGMYKPDQLWGPGNTGTLQEDQCPVLTDVFVRNAVIGAEEMAGSPVLYYKADPTKRFRVDSANQVVNPAVDTEYRQWSYNFDDNIDILNLAWLRSPGSAEDLPGLPPHYQDHDDYDGVTDAELFYQILTQRENSTTGFYKPYNANTYILISAGRDGIYGTRDDITNFNY